MKRLILGTMLAALCGAALADGANLTYLPAPVLNSTEQAKFNAVAARDTTIGMTTTAIDSTAIDTPTGVVNVYLNGALQRFVGSKTTMTTPGGTLASWRGSNGVSSLVLSRGGTGSVAYGRASLNDPATGQMRYYEILQIGPGSAVAVEQNKAYDQMD